MLLFNIFFKSRWMFARKTFQNKSSPAGNGKILNSLFLPPHLVPLSCAFLLSSQLDMLDSFLGDVTLSRNIFQDACSAGFNSLMCMICSRTPRGVHFQNVIFHCPHLLWQT